MSDRRSWRWLALVNPTAGRGLDSGRRDALADALRRRLGATVVFEPPGEALPATAAAYDGLAVYGGDGSLAAAVGALDHGADRLPVILPLVGGTGNGVARDLGLDSLATALDATETGVIVTMDLMRVDLDGPSVQGTRLAVSTAGLGYAADAVATAETLPRRLRQSRYVVAAGLKAFRQPVIVGELAEDERPAVEVSFTNFLVGVTRHVGNFPAFPDRRAGRLTALVARVGAPAQLAHDASALLGWHVYRPGRVISPHTLRLVLDEPRTLMVDGELVAGVDRVRFSVMPAAVSMLAPAPGHGRLPVGRAA